MNWNWMEKTPLPKAQAGGAVALMNGAMVIAGGTHWENDVKLWLRDVQVYDVRSDQWRQGPLLPSALGYGPYTQSSAGLEIYGGSDGVTASRKIYTLDAGLKGWKQTGEAPAMVLLGHAARVGSAVYLIGGCEDVADLTRCTDAVWKRVDGGKWEKVGSIPNGPVALGATAVVDGRIYLFGGCSMPGGKLRNHSEAWMFDPGRGSWKALRGLGAANRGLTAVASGGRVFLFGGYTDAGFTADVVAYDPLKDSYEAQPAMPLATVGLQFVVDGGRIWGAGGEHKMRARSARAFTAALPLGR
ncbi:MAG: kelch repeat-containing protein [Bryobacteraceae bacterium]